MPPRDSRPRPHLMFGSRSPSGASIGDLYSRRHNPSRTMLTRQDPAATETLHALNV